MQTFREFLDTVRIVAYVAMGIIALIVYRKFFGDNSVTQVVDNTIQGAADIKNGLPGLISDTLTGKNDSTYITADQQKAMAAANLAAVRAAQGF